MNEWVLVVVPTPALHYHVFTGRPPHAPRPKPFAALRRVVRAAAYTLTIGCNIYKMLPAF